MPHSPPPTLRAAHFPRRGPTPRIPSMGDSDRDALLQPTDDNHGEGPSRPRAVSIAQSIASITSFVSAASSAGLAAARGGARQVSGGPPRPKSPSVASEASSPEDTDSRPSLGLDDELDLLDDDFDLDYDEDEVGSDEPLVRRRRRRYTDEHGDQSLVELVPPLILAHPLALFPALAAVPHDFLPAGVALFVPLFCVLALLSVCAHIVIVYLAWYLKVRTFEDVFATCAGERFGLYALGVGRAFVLVSTLGASVGFLGSELALLDKLTAALPGLMQPLAQTYFPEGFLQTRLFWTLLASATIIPALVPSRTLRGLRRAPIFFALLLPVVAFVTIGRTVEVKKLADEALVKRGVVEAVKGRLEARGLNAGSAGSGLTTLAMFFSPHLQTLSVHQTLQRAQRQKFFIPAFAATLITVLLAIPFVLVPYYLLPPAPTGLAQLPADDGWSNAARVLMAAVALGSTTTWLLRGRDCVLVALDVDRGERYKAGRWVGLGMWAVVVTLACVGGWVADKVELLGVMATIAVGWLLPSLFFIITFHVRSPLAIIFPSHAPPPPPPEELVPRTLRSDEAGPSNGHARTASLDDPATDVLLARKEHQLQKRRLGRRLWQDMVVYVGILPVGCVTLVWCVGTFLGLW